MTVRHSLRLPLITYPLPCRCKTPIVSQIPALFQFYQGCCGHPVTYNYSTVPLPCGLRPPNSAKSSVHFPIEQLCLASSVVPHSPQCEELRYFRCMPRKAFAYIIFLSIIQIYVLYHLSYLSQRTRQDSNLYYYFSQTGDVLPRGSATF